MVKIGNIRTFIPDGSIAIKVDRTSPLGNPFYMTTEEQRDIICDAYDSYFKDMIEHNRNRRFLHELERIHDLSKTNDITLLCWCAPKRCHAETIKKYLEEN